MLPENMDASTVQSEGWGRVTNGALLKLAFERGFNALLSIVSQHNEATLSLPVVIRAVNRLRVDLLAPLLPLAIDELTADISPDSRL